MRKFVRTASCIAVVGVAVLFPADARASGAASANPSLLSVTSGKRPGPAVLYAPAPSAPQLESRDHRFSASPLLVSGAEAYERGEYLYQDHLNDDFGSDTDGSTASPFGAFAGDIVYPTDRARYAGNAADLVEFRVAPSATAVAYRVTLNTLVVADSTIVSIAYDTDNNALTGQSTLPRDPGSPFPGTDEVITTWGTGAEHSRLSTVGTAVTTAVGVTTDLEANQITVTVPRSVSNPHGVWKATVAVGLLDRTTGGWLHPAMSATATRPGGASLTVPAPSGIFNLAFRPTETYLSQASPPDVQQAGVLRAGTQTNYARAIDFAALDAKASRNTLPTSGTEVRIFASSLSLGEGRDFTVFPAFQGQLQPYSLYVPTTYDPSRPAPMTLLLHAADQYHWQYNGSLGARQIGEPRGNFLVTPLSRGANGWYQHSAEHDAFEVWADVARHFSLDPTRAYVAGYSMGGYGAYRFATLYPDLFARGYTIAGPPAESPWVPPLAPTAANTLTNTWLPNARHVPFLNVASTEDEVVPVPGPIAQNLGLPLLGIQGFDTLGYQFRYQQVAVGEHFTYGFTGYNNAGARDFLGDALVVRDPAHVTYVYTPAADDTALGLVHDHAYWVSDVRLADTSAVGNGIAKIDAFSHASGRGDPASTGGQTTGILSSGLPYVEFNRVWGVPPSIPASNTLTVRAENVGAVSLAVDRAGLDPTQPLTIEMTSTHPAVLTLYRRGATTITIAVTAGAHQYVIAPA